MCENIVRTYQCFSGAGVTSLSEKCGLYNNLCKTLCSKLSEDPCKSSLRTDDCFWLENNGTSVAAHCVDKVL
jgi:hypothetical protein